MADDAADAPEPEEEAEGSDAMSYHGESDEDDNDMSLEEAESILAGEDDDEETEEEETDAADLMYDDTKDEEDEQDGDVEMSTEGEFDEPDESDEGTDVDADADEDLDEESLEEADGDELDDEALEEDAEDDLDEALDEDAEDDPDFDSDADLEEAEELDDNMDDVDLLEESEGDEDLDDESLEEADGDELDDTLEEEAEDELDDELGEDMDDATEEEGCGSDMMSAEEDEELDEDEDAEEEDAESGAGPFTSRKPTALTPGKPMPVTFFGPPPDAGSTVAFYRCAGCSYRGITVKPVVASASTSKDIRRQIEPLAASYGLTVNFIRAGDDVVVKMTKGDKKMFASLREAAEGIFNVSKKNAASFVVSGSSNVFCPVCSTTMHESHLPRTAAVSDRDIVDVSIVSGKCKQHGKMYTSDRNSVLGFCSRCAEDLEPENDEVSVPVADVEDLDEEVQEQDVEASLHQANTENPFWNVFYRGTPVARIELQAQEKPMQIREQFLSASYGKAVRQACARFGFVEAFESLNASQYVAKAATAKIIANTSSKIRKAATTVLESERKAMLDNFFNGFKLAMVGFDKNMFPTEGHPIKEILADALAEAGVSDPISVTEDVLASGCVAAYVEACVEKAGTFMQMDPRELSGQAAMITGGKTQVTSSASSLGSEMRTGSDMRRRMAETSVPIQPTSSSSYTREDRKAELRSRLNLGASFRRG
jgi:hypothetical protein